MGEAVGMLEAGGMGGMGEAVGILEAGGMGGAGGIEEAVGMGGIELVAIDDAGGIALAPAIGRAAVPDLSSSLLISP